MRILKEKKAHQHYITTHTHTKNNNRYIYCHEQYAELTFKNIIRGLIKSDYDG